MKGKYAVITPVILKEAREMKRDGYQLPDIAHKLGVDKVKLARALQAVQDTRSRRF